MPVGHGGGEAHAPRLKMAVLGDESRARVLMALRHCPVCVCEITTFLNLAASTHASPGAARRKVMSAISEGTSTRSGKPFQSPAPVLT